MTEDLIIIIPTHNRQHYLRRVIKYYSSFPCKVYICDSTPEVFIFEEELPSNIEYISCPDKNFYQKVYSVIKNTEVPFYALSPDDDFIKLETLKECYEVLKNNENYSFATGKQICFNKPFDNKFVNIDVANLLSYINFESFENRNDYLRYFWSHYQNILWSLYRRDVIFKTFTCLSLCNFSNGNFIELLLGIEGLRAGDIYVSREGFNYRELIKGQHWGTTVLSITENNIRRDENLREDVNRFENYYKNDGGFSHKCLQLYLYNFRTSRLKRLIGKMLPGKVERLITSKLSHANYSISEYKDDEMLALVGNIVNN